MEECRQATGATWETVSTYLVDKIKKDGTANVRGTQINSMTAEWIATQLQIVVRYNSEKDRFTFSNE